MSYDERLHIAANYCRKNSGYSIVKLNGEKRFFLVRSVTGSRAARSRAWLVGD